MVMAHFNSMLLKISSIHLLLIDTADSYIKAKRYVGVKRSIMATLYLIGFQLSYFERFYIFGKIGASRAIEVVVLQKK